MHQAKRPDLGFALIVGLVGLVSVWLLAMPFVPAIARATMHRFHLRSDSFAAFAIQQPIPAMYNLANRYAVYDVQPDSWSRSAEPSARSDANGSRTEPIESGYLNHFPVRTVTFSTERYRLLKDHQERWFELESAYRGQSLATRIHVQPVDDRVQRWAPLTPRRGLETERAR